MDLLPSKDDTEEIDTKDKFLFTLYLYSEKN